MGEMMSRIFVASALLVAFGCTGSSEDAADPGTFDDVEPAAEEAPVGTPPQEEVMPDGDGSAWVSRPVPFVAYFHDVTVAFRLDQATALAGVVGIADGKVDDAADLGPSIQLTSDGKLLAMDGANGYRADADATYVGAPVDIIFKINLETHRYSVEANGVTIAREYAFAPAQAELSRIDTIASDVAVELRELVVGPRWCSVAGQSWIDLPHPEQSSPYRVQFEAQVPAEVRDGVVGLAALDATDPDPLAAAIRLTDARIEARDGAAYRATATYEPDTFYVVTMDVDTAARTYSLALDGVTVASDLALADAPAPRLGAHAAGGYVRVCDVTVWNY